MHRICFRYGYRMGLLSMLILVVTRPASSKTVGDDSNTRLAREITAPLMGQNASYTIRGAEFEKLLRQSVGVRNAGLKILLGSRSASFVVEAANACIRLNVPGSTETIVQQMSRLDDRSRRIILGRASSRVAFDATQTSLMKVAREVLRVRTRESSRPLPKDDDTYQSQDYAGFMLANSDRPDDGALILRTLRVRPASPGLWLAASRSGLPAQHKELARRIYTDAKSATFVRITAAVALARQDEKARDFVAHSLRHIIDTIGSQDGDAQVLTLIRLQNDPKHRAAFQSAAKIFMHAQREQAPLVALNYLEASSAEPLVFLAIKARRQTIKGLGGAIAANRFPRRFLATIDGKSFRLEGYRSLLALLVQRHPEFTSQVKTKISGRALDGAIAKLKSWGAVDIDGGHLFK